MVTRDPDRIPWNEQKYQQSVVDTMIPYGTYVVGHCSLGSESIID